MIETATSSRALPVATNLETLSIAKDVDGVKSTIVEDVKLEGANLASIKGARSDNERSVGLGGKLVDRKQWRFKVTLGQERVVFSRVHPVLAIFAQNKISNKHSKKEKKKGRKKEKTNRKEPRKRKSQDHRDFQVVQGQR